MTTTATATAARHSSVSSEHFTPSDIVERARRVLGVIDLDPATCEEANRTVMARIAFDAKADGYTRPWGSPELGARVFLNPPGGLSDDQQRLVLPKCRETGSCGLPVGHTHEGVESNQKKWWFKLAHEYLAGHVLSAIFVCFSVELLQTTQVNPALYENRLLLLPLDFPICYPSRRVPYVKPGGEVGTSPPHASCIVYLPPRLGVPPRHVGVEDIVDGARVDGVRLFEGVFQNLGKVVVPRTPARPP